MPKRIFLGLLKVLVLWGALPAHLACEGRLPNKQEARIMEEVRKADRRIDFYGQVLDDQGQPVEGAEVTLHLRRFDPLNLMGLFEDIVPFTLKTDKGGHFAIHGERGNSLSVQDIKKVHYDDSVFRHTKIPRDFNYGEQDLTRPFHTPDPKNPMVYRLRKKGPEAFLWKGGGGFSFTDRESGSCKGYDFFREGPDFPMKAEDLAHPKVYGNPVTCDLRAQATLDPRTGTWTVVLAPGNPEGGIQASMELLYEAPETGYQPSLSFQVEGRGPKDPREHGETKTPVPAKYLYLRSRKAPIYSRINLDEGFRVAWGPSPKDPKTLLQEIHFGGGATLNPYGERILEEATDLPGDVRLKLMDGVDEAIRHGVRPTSPDLPKLVEEWRKSRPLTEKLKDLLKR